jgi:hypothetical protein
MDLGSSREITSVTMGFLQDTGSWIFMPRRITVQASEDGGTFQQVGIAENVVAADERRATVRDFVVKPATPIRARHLKIHVVTYGRLPSWHPGAGEDAWFFTDEIVLK